MTRFASGIAALSAAALIGIAGIASAQPHHGHHGFAGGGDAVMAIAGLKSQLNLNTSQQAMWDNAIALSKSARDSARTTRQKVRDTLTAELAKPEPDLTAVANAADAARDAAAASRRQVRDAWLALYGTFTPEQKAVVKNSIQEHMTRMEQFREKMRQRHPQRG